MTGAAGEDSLVPLAMLLTIFWDSRLRSRANNNIVAFHPSVLWKLVPAATELVYQLLGIRRTSGRHVFNC